MCSVTRFQCRFRLPRTRLLQICSLLKPQLQRETRRSNPIPPHVSFWISESKTSTSEPVKLFFLRLDAILMTVNSTLPGTGERKHSLIWYYFGHGVCKFAILVHVHLNTHGWHSSCLRMSFTHFSEVKSVC